MLMLALPKTDIDTYVKGKTWYWYVPVWLFGLYLFVELLSFELGGDNPAFILTIPHAVNFVVHEFAHVMFGFAPSIVTAAAGSFSELLLGALLVWGAFKGQTYFASLFCFLWFMLSAQSTADYMADARTQRLPLANFDASGAAPIHDWHFIFGQLDLLSADTFVAGIFRTLGVLAGLAGIIFSAWLMYRIAGAKKADELNQKEAELLHHTAAAAGIKAAPPKHFKDLKEGTLYPMPIKGRLSEDAENPKDKQKGAV